jgi:integrase
MPNAHIGGGCPGLRDYIAGRRKEGVDPGTINREIGLLSSVLNWARRELEWDVPNPARNRWMREPAGRARWLTRRAEAAALIQAARTNKLASHLADFIVLGLHTGLRPGCQ